jgi:hypothetical protein
MQHDVVDTVVISTVPRGVATRADGVDATTGGPNDAASITSGATQGLQNGVAGHLLVDLCLDPFGIGRCGGTNRACAESAPGLKAVSRPNQDAGAPAASNPLEDRYPYSRQVVPPPIAICCSFPVPTPNCTLMAKAEPGSSDTKLSHVGIHGWEG